MIKDFRLHLAVAALWAALGFACGWLVRGGERPEVAVTAATIAAVMPVMLWQVWRTVRRYRYRAAHPVPGDAGRPELARDRLQTVVTLAACFGLFAVAVFSVLLDLERRSTVLFVCLELVILLLAAWAIHTSLLQDAAEQQMDRQDAAVVLDVQRQERDQIGRDTRLAGVVEATKERVEATQEKVEATQEKVEEIAEVTQATHVLVNSNFGTALLEILQGKIDVEALTPDPARKAAARIAVVAARKAYDDHMAQQAVVDAGALATPPPQQEGGR